MSSIGEKAAKHLFKETGISYIPGRDGPTSTQEAGAIINDVLAEREDWQNQYDESTIELAFKWWNFTHDCREDFHEPDEQGIELQGVVGTKLDNAFGEQTIEKFLQEGYHEAVLMFHKDDETVVGEHLQINLARLCALARIGAREILRQQGENI